VAAKWGKFGIDRKVFGQHSGEMLEEVAASPSSALPQMGGTAADSAAVVMASHKDQTPPLRADLAMATTKRGREWPPKE